jgi:hypothetical protein
MFVLIATEFTRSDTTVEHRETRYIKVLARYETTKELVAGWRLVSEIQKKLAVPCVPCHCKQNLTLILLMWRTGWANSIPIYIQQDTTLHSLFISGNCSTCFGWYLYPSSGARTTVSTASGICHTLTAICRYRGRVGTGLSVLWVAYAIHSTLIYQML